MTLLKTNNRTTKQLHKALTVHFKFIAWLMYFKENWTGTNFETAKRLNNIKLQVKIFDEERDEASHGLCVLKDFILPKL